MIILDISQEALEAILVFCGTLVLFALKKRVADVCAAMFAPVLGLFKSLERVLVKG